MDDLDHPLASPWSLSRPVQRVVSLVPSLTEAVAETRPEALVGATDWCSHPAGLDVARVRGTKNPDLASIRALRPDVVLANQEENRELDVRRLREAGVDVWVTRIETLDQAFTSLHRLFDALGWPSPAWLAVAEDAWREPGSDGRRVAVPVWRDPWMVVGSATFTGDLLARLGLVNAFASAAQRYPHTTVEQIRAENPDLVVLPDEPYRFSAEDGPEALDPLPCRVVDGRSLTWYGPSLVTARDILTRQLRG